MAGADRGSNTLEEAIHSEAALFNTDLATPAIDPLTTASTTAF
jgi:hypothetical protein